MNIKTTFNIDELIQIIKGRHKKQIGYIKAFKFENNKEYYKIELITLHIKIWLSEYNIKSIEMN